jgi:predicted NUDIX family phosphoesterase
MESTSFFSSLHQINSISDANSNDGQQKLLLPENINIEYFPEEGLVKTNGLGNLDKKKDLLEIVEIQSAIEGKYTGCRVFSPRPYLESLDPIPTHVTVQGIILSNPTSSTAQDIRNLLAQYQYGKTPYDKLWVSSSSFETLGDEELIMIMNRRIGGWDGSKDRPVIELLGAGGHIPAVWRNGSFQSLSPDETIKNEIKEELGLSNEDYSAKMLGGFVNVITGELVILYGVMVPWSLVVSMQATAYGNEAENTDGIYLGLYKDIMRSYLVDATPFAGGEKAKATNFPSQSELMSHINRIFEI